MCFAHKRGRIQSYLRWNRRKQLGKSAILALSFIVEWFAMRPTYTSYRQLQSYYEKDVDYKISESPVRSNVGVFSPHGGGIEQGVSELVHAIARDELSWYLFEGTRTTGNWALHISSHLFNEPRGVA